MRQIISGIVVLSLLVIAAIVPINSSTTHIESSSMLISTNTAIDEMPMHLNPTTDLAIEITNEKNVEDYQKTTVINDTELENEYSFDDYNLDLLARVIYVEAGCYWIPDWVQLYVGSVVLNRVESNLYPNTIEGVLYDPWQYEPDKLYLEEPSNNAREIARQLLESGSILPPDVLGQNGDGTGDGIYATYYDEALDSTIYFTYVYS